MTRLLLAAAVGGVVALATAGCGGPATPVTASRTGSAGAPTPGSPTAGSPSAASAAMPLGPGCANYSRRVPAGPGSFSRMAATPLSAAAAGSPLLNTLSAALSGRLNPKVDLADVLDGGQFTVFAPVDAAFRKLPAATTARLETDPGELTKVLTYHVLAGRIAPDAIAGRHRTVEGSSVTVTGPSDALLVDGATVICGGVRTANATVYIIDEVLTPAA
jgi:uncharacterized surface protein with fasciclin (FAS1) repeats